MRKPYSTRSIGKTTIAVDRITRDNINRLAESAGVPVSEYMKLILKEKMGAEELQANLSNASTALTEIHNLNDKLDHLLKHILDGDFNNRTPRHNENPPVPFHSDDQVINDIREGISEMRDKAKLLEGMLTQNMPGSSGSEDNIGNIQSIE